jgi:hypothetical protein
MAKESDKLYTILDKNNKENKDKIKQVKQELET